MCLEIEKFNPLKKILLNKEKKKLFNIFTQFKFDNMWANNLDVQVIIDQ